ncbi:MAG: GDYXXLXY domain-containing protein [Burkholderiales bacterium]
MRRALVLLAGLVVLLVIDWTIAARERIVTDGRVVLLELAPVDPRSLMQGDYMALRFRVVDALPRGNTAPIPADGWLVVGVAADDVATYRRLDDGTPLAPDEVRLRYRVRDRSVRLATDAFFFPEGQGARYAGARYGEFRVAADGEALLTGLRDAGRKPL